MMMFYRLITHKVLLKCVKESKQHTEPEVPGPVPNCNGEQDEFILLVHISVKPHKSSSGSLKMWVSAHLFGYSDEPYKQSNCTKVCNVPFNQNSST